MPLDTVQWPETLRPLRTYSTRLQRPTFPQYAGMGRVQWPRSGFMGMGALKPAFQAQEELKVGPEETPSAAQAQAFNLLMQAMAEPLMEAQDRIVAAQRGVSVQAVSALSPSWQKRLAAEQAFTAKMTDEYAKRADAIYRARDPQRWNAFVQRAVPIMFAAMMATVEDIERSMRQEKVPAGAAPAHIAAAKDLGISPPVVKAASANPAPSKKSNERGALMTALVGGGLLGAVAFLGGRR